MDDLLTWLRASFEGVPRCAKCAEAADLIERLRTAGAAALADLADGDDASAYQILKANFSPEKSDGDADD